MSTFATIHRLHWPDVQDIRSLVGSTLATRDQSAWSTFLLIRAPEAWKGIWLQGRRRPMRCPTALETPRAGRRGIGHFSTQDHSAALYAPDGRGERPDRRFARRPLGATLRRRSRRRLGSGSISRPCLRGALVVRSAKSSQHEQRPDGASAAGVSAVRGRVCGEACDRGSSEGQGRYSSVAAPRRSLDTRLDAAASNPGSRPGHAFRRCGGGAERQRFRAAPRRRDKSARGGVAVLSRVRSEDPRRGAGAIRALLPDRQRGFG